MSALSDVGPAIPAAQYLRMSTDHQRYSLENQQAAIAEYAARHGYDVVRTYADPGKSGLTLRGRTALQALLSEAMAPDRPFDAVLVFDISRWGRFQDPDEAAHYEFICRQAGLRVIYCAELFSSDPDSLETKLLKHMKRIMAGEYSRDLSAKLCRAHRQQAALGFKQGGSAPYGFRRLVLDSEGRPRMLLEAGQQKAIATDRVILIPGPANELETVKRIFRWCARDKLPAKKILERLSAEGNRSDTGRPWTDQAIYGILRNEAYIGFYTYCKTTHRLGGRPRPTPRDLWVRSKTLPPTVSERQFKNAGATLSNRKRAWYSRQVLLRRLSAILERYGYISSALLQQDGRRPSRYTYVKRFGSLRKAYALVGYTSPTCRGNMRGAVPWTDEELIHGLQRLHRTHGYVCSRLINDDPALPSIASFTARFGSLRRAYERAGLPSSPKEIQAGVAARWAWAAPRPIYPRLDGRDLVMGMPNGQILEALRAILNERGYLSQRLIDDDPRTPSAATVRKRFGRLERAYKLAGWRMESTKTAAETYKRRSQRVNAWVRDANATASATKSTT